MLSDGEKRKHREAPLEIAKRRMNRRKRPIDSTDNPRDAQVQVTSRRTSLLAFIVDVMSAAVCIGDYARQRRQFHCSLRYFFQGLSSDRHNHTQ